MLHNEYVAECLEALKQLVQKRVLKVVKQDSQSSFVAGFKPHA